MRARLLLACLLGGLALACVPKNDRPRAPGQEGEKRVALVFTADLWGQLEPCGCSADMRGGLDRAASWVEAQRRAGPTLLIDAGDAWFDAPSYDPRFEAQARRRARAVAEALLAMGVDAKAHFERDRGLEEPILPEDRFLDRPKILEAGGVRLGLVAVDATAGDVEAPLREGVASLKAQGADLVAAIVHGPRQRVIALSEQVAEAGVAFVVGSHIDTLEEGEEARMVPARIPVFFTQARGQSLLQIELVLRGEGPLQLAGNEAEREREMEGLDGRIATYLARAAEAGDPAARAAFEEKARELQARRRQLADEPVTPPATGNYLAWRFVPVTQDRPSDPEVKAVLAAYDRDVAQANLARARANPVPCPEAAPGAARFVGGEACAGCHAAATAFWKGTGHARAYETLERIEKQYDLSCIGCHVTGWERPGGVCDVAHVEGRKDVTCESCHGPGSLHVAAPQAAKLPAQVPESTCRSCHTPENSTAFDYATYLPKTLGPGHGQPAQQTK